MADSKKLIFSTSPKAEQFPPKFHGLVLGLVELIDVKGIDEAQPKIQEMRSVVTFSLHISSSRTKHAGLDF